MNFYEKASVSLYIDELKLIEEKISKHHHILLYQHNKLGKVLVMDEEIMHIEKYECFYHEPLVHLPFAIRPNAETILILGGGSLFAAREVLKYKSVKKLILCDHDKEVLNIMTKYYNHCYSVINDSRFIYIENDALSFLHNNITKFDLIINDCFDLSKTYIDKKNLYDVLDNHITENGLCSDMVYNDIYDQKTMTASLGHLKRKVSIFYSLMVVPEYPGILHLHTIWSKNKVEPNLGNPSRTQIEMFKNNKFELFNPNYLEYYFYLPKFVLDIIK